MSGIRVLGSLETVVRGAVGLCLLVARDIVRTMLTALFTGVIPGFASSAMAARVSSEIERITGVLTGWMDSMASGAASFLDTTPAAINTLFDAVEDAIWTHTSWIRFLARDLVPNLQRYLEGLIVATRSYLLNVIAYENSRTQALMWATVSAVDRRLSLSINAMHALIVTYINIINQQINAAHRDARMWAEYLFTVALTDLAKTRQNLIALVNATARALTTYTDRAAQSAREMAIRTSLEGARTYTNQQVVALRDAFARAFTTAVTPPWGAVRDAETGILADFPKGAAAHTRKVGAIPEKVPQALPEVFGAASAMGVLSLSWIRDAGIPLWRRLHTFGDTVDQMQDDSLIEGVLTLLTYAILDPRGSAKEAAVDMSSTLSGVAGGTIQSLFPSNGSE
jgi:hypothetical protein